MMRVVITDLTAHKLRLFLTTLAVVLGVSLVGGAYVLTDGIDKSLNSILSTTYDETDAVVTPIGGGAALADAISPALLEEIRALPEVEDAAGTLIDLSGGAHPANLLDEGGNRIGARRTFAFGIDPEADQFNPLDLVEGRWADEDGEVVIDAKTATSHGYSVGDRISVAVRGPTESFDVVGIAKFAADPIGGASIALFDLETAQRLHRRDGFDTIAIEAKDGVLAGELLASVRPLLPTGTIVRTGESQAAADTVDASRFVEFIRYFLLGFAGIALLVGAVVIVNTMSIGVAQKTRQLATLRMIGASRQQVMRSVVLEGLLIGIAGSLLGLAGGFIFAKGLSAIFSLLDAGLPDVPTVFAARTAVVSLLAGIVVSSAAALVPAIRATRVAPLEAVRRSQATAVAATSARTPRLAIAFLVIGAAVVGGGAISGELSSNSRLIMVVAGGISAFVGSALIAPQITRPLVTLLTRPLTLLGDAVSSLARENAVRNPKRTAATAMALMIGLALATFAGVVGKSIVTSGESAIRNQIRADYILESQGSQPEGQDVGQAIVSTPGIVAAATIRNMRDGALLASGEPVDVSGVDPSIGEVYRFAWQSPSDADTTRLAGNQAVIDATVARSEDVEVGDALVLRTTTGDTIETTVHGIFKRPPLDALVGEVLIPQALFTQSFPEMVQTSTLVRAQDADALQAALAPFPHAMVRSPEDIAQNLHRALISVLRLLYVLLALAVVVSLLGMVNTLVMAVLERTREIGMLRAIGMTRRQVRRMICVEAILTALLGAALGIPVGVAVAAAVTQAAGDTISLSIPIGTVSALVAVTIFVGVVASVLPARRASRLNVLEAIVYE